MRIFYAADHEPMPGNNLWHNNLYLPLVDLGHDVVPFDYDLTPHFLNANAEHAPHRAFIEEQRPKLERALFHQVEQAHRTKPIDIFFSYFFDPVCRPEVIREIRALGICTINWYCNGSYQFHLISHLAPAYDYCLVPEKFRLADYIAVGANPIYCQEAANPNIYKPYPLPRSFAVTFVGQKYGDRPAFIKHLLKSGIDVRVWGPGWDCPQPPDAWSRLIRKSKTFGASLLGRDSGISIPSRVCGPPLTDEELIKMYSRSDVSLGFSSCGGTHRDEQRILQVRLRDFEATMSGAFYMVEYQEELEEFFEPDKEIVCYLDKEDMAEKIKYYTRHDQERERIREAGHRRAVNDHTWQKRFQKVFEEIGIAA
jgi:spore maturation protein CgeB